MTAPTRVSRTRQVAAKLTGVRPSHAVAPVAPSYERSLRRQSGFSRLPGTTPTGAGL